MSPGSHNISGFVIFFPVFYLHHNCENQINILLYVVLCLNSKKLTYAKSIYPLNILLSILLMA